MADFQQNFLASLQGGLDIGRQIRGVQDRNQLNKLAAQSYSTPTDQRDGLLSQMAGVDARAAQQQEQAFENTDERRNTTMVNMAKMLTTAPEQARAGLYQRMLPTLSTFGMSELPQEYNAQTAPIIDQAAQSLVQAYGGAGMQTPTDVRSFEMMTANLSPEDRARAQRITLGLDPRQSSAAIGYQKVKGADGIERLVAVDPRQIGAQVIGGGDSYGSFAEPPAAQQGPPSSGSHFASFSQLATEFPAATMTSGARSAERNAQVGGQPNSQHLAGTAADYAVPANQKPAFISRARQLGYDAIDEGDHIHLQLPRGARSGGAAAFAGRRPEDEAAATEAAKLNVQQQYLPSELAARTQAAITQTAGIEQVKSQQERASNERAKSAQLNNVDRGLSRIDTALKGLTGAFVDTGPIDGRIMSSTPQGQELAAAVGAIQNDMLALTRVPGVGSQSDLEQKIANLKYPSIYNAPEVNARNVEQLKAFAGDLRRQIQGAPTQASDAGSVPRQIQSAEEYSALPSGALFIAPDGTQRRKR